MTSRSKFILGSMSILVGLAPLPAAMASEGIEEVVVQARKRSENLQEVPVAVSAITGAQLDQMDARSVMDLSATVPNFLAPRNTVSFGAPQFYMRGAGRANNNWNAENAVAVFIDDVYMQSTAGAYIDMIDFESVEVLRGPQGTLYGRNATTGAIKFTPRRPDLQELILKGDVTVGSHDRRDIRGTLGMPLIDDKLAFKLDVYHTENDGYLTLVNESNQSLDDKFGHQEHFGARLATLWQLTDTLHMELNLDYADQDDGTNLITPIAPENPLDFTQVLSKRGNVKFRPVFGENRAAGEPLLGKGGSTLHSFGAVYKINWETDLGTFRSITGWREYEDRFNSQLGGRAVPSTLFGVTIYSFVNSYNDFKQFTQEFQFAGKLGERIDYVAGLYYFDNDWPQSQYGSAIGVPANFSPVFYPGQTQSFGGSWSNTSLKAKSYAAYVDATWKLTDSVSAFFGGRYTKDKKDVDYDARFEDNVLEYPGFPVTASKTSNDFSPRIGLNWQALDNLMVYASYSKGYKAGSLEGDRATDPVPATTWLKPEIVKTFEVGLKGQWFDDRLRTNLALFKSKYSDKADLISPQTAATADVDIDGAEIELVWAPVESLRFWLNAGLMDAKYTSAQPNHPIFAPDPTGFAPGLKAKPVMTPDYSYTLGGDYTLALADLGSLMLGFSLQGIDDHFNGLGVNNYDSEKVDGYEVLDASLTYRSRNEKFSATLGGTNLTDESYWSTGFFGSVPEWAGRYYADGRAWYLRLQYSY